MAVEFNEPNRFSQTPPTGGMTGWLIKNGLAKNETSAQMIMIVLIVLCFGLSIYFFTKAF